MAAGSRLIMLSHGMWERVFGADRSVIGRVVRLNGVGFEVIGVMPETFFDLAEREGRSVEPLDPGVLAGACFILVTAAAAAWALPAWRAASVDPSIALRDEY